MISNILFNFNNIKTLIYYVRHYMFIILIHYDYIICFDNTILSLAKVFSIFSVTNVLDVSLSQLIIIRSSFSIFPINA